MEEKDFIKDLFADKLANAQAPVNPELWSAISSKIGASTAVSSSLSATAKWLIGLGTAASVTVATLYITQDATSPKVEINKVVDNKDKTEIEKIDKVEDKEYGTRFSPPVIVNILDEFEEVKPSSETQAYWSIQSFPVNVVDTSKHDSFVGNGVVTEVKENAPENRNLHENATTVESNKQTFVTSFEVKQLPNVFTINNDGKNDHFFIEMKGIEDFVLNVLNSKNEVVYSAVDADFKWDGRDKQGNLVDSGSYVYFFTGKDLQGNPISKHNSLRIIVK